jgi:hypothetical protein
MFKKKKKKKNNDKKKFSHWFKIHRTFSFLPVSSNGLGGMLPHVIAYHVLLSTYSYNMYYYLIIPLYKH